MAPLRQVLPERYRVVAPLLQELPESYGAVAPLGQVLPERYGVAAPPLQVLPERHGYSQPWTDRGGILLYAAGCSFVAYLLERYGAGPLRALLRALTCDDQDDAVAVAARFQAAFGISLEAADAAWRARELAVRTRR